MQKVVYISNSRDFTEQNDINENKYLKRINKLLEEGWVSFPDEHTDCGCRPQAGKLPFHKETLVSFVILEKPE